MVKTNEKQNIETSNKNQHTPCVLDEALTFLKKDAPAKFVEKVDISLQTGIDARKMMVRGMARLPNGTGKSVSVAVFATGDLAKSAEKAGAHRVGFEDLFEELKGDDWNYDVIIATPEAMAMVGKLGKKLGPKGLMPNPKLGTVTSDVQKAVTSALAGQVQFKLDKAGIIHCSIGTVEFSNQALEENLLALLSEVKKSKPAAAKGQYLRKLSVSTTMSKGSYLVDLTKLTI
ncbi:MAG: 50S ribosomal protein L1 [Legionellales bacterium]|nr:50S ribosomal protein L1 [Legionellales bacterium]|tara:strand:- start:665 stop:1357 length:693 start_codon:yes stop_codon:yes gene_type:complete